MCGLLRLLEELNEPSLLSKLKKDDAKVNTRIRYIFSIKSVPHFTVYRLTLLLWCLMTRKLRPGKVTVLAGCGTSPWTQS